MPRDLQAPLEVLDEAQFITDPTRGISVELLLTYLIAARECGITPQVVALSAVIGDANDFHAWLGCQLLVSDQRPVPLTEGVIDRTGTYQYLGPDGQTGERQLVPGYEVRLRGEKPSGQDLLVSLVLRLIGVGEKAIVFRNQRGAAQGCALYLARDLGFPPADDVASLLPTGDHSGALRALRQSLGGGTDFHNRNLTGEGRLAVEQAFRQPDSRLRALVATTTVAAGINTPASTTSLND